MTKMFTKNKETKTLVTKIMLTSFTIVKTRLTVTCKGTMFFKAALENAYFKVTIIEKII